MTPIWQENRSCPLLRFSINIYGTSRFITLHPLRLHFYFLKIQKQRKTWERFWDEKMSRSSSGTKAPAWRQTSETWQFGPKTVYKEMSRLPPPASPPPHPAPSIWFSDFFNLSVRNNRARHKNKACLGAAGLWQEMQETLSPSLLEHLLCGTLSSHTWDKTRTQGWWHLHQTRECLTW